MAMITDNDLEIIMKGSQEQVIRKMLKDRLFCLVILPEEKPEMVVSRFSSSIFVSRMNTYGFTRALAIRNVGSKDKYERCQYYLRVYEKRGVDEESKRYFEKFYHRSIRQFASFSYPTVDELCGFLKDKELFLISNWMQYGNMESMKVKDFLKHILFLWKDSESEFIMRDEFCDIRVFLRQIDDETGDSDDRIRSADVRDFEIWRRIVNILKKRSRDYYQHMHYCAEYETQQGEVQAAYFVTRFHSNTAWEADPVNIVNSRISAFVLPGKVSSSKATTFTGSKKTRKLSNGTKYVIDSIHGNSDVFSDMSEFKEYLDTYLCYFSYD